MKIFLVSENSESIKQLQAMFFGMQDKFIELSWTGNFSNGLAYLSKEKPDLILLELPFQERGETDGLIQIREMTRFAPVLVLADFEDKRLGVDAIRAGAQDFLNKSKITDTALERCVQYAVERKNLEKKVWKYEEQFSRLVEKTFDGMVLLDKEGVVIFANPAMRSFTGIDASELKGVPFGFPILKDEAAEIDFNHPRKGVVVAEMRIVELDWEGEIAYLASLRDISDRKKAENEKAMLEEQLRQMQKMESIGTLAGGIAHDFNNILAIILGNSEMAIDSVPEWNAARECLGEIQAAAIRARDLVQHILKFSRKAVINRKPIKIGPIVQDTLKMLRASIPAEVEIRKNIFCESDIIWGDPVQISQVFINLCTNAAYAMHEEGGILDVSLDNVEFEKKDPIIDLEPGHYLKLVVSDSGKGINPKHIGRIFDPYFTTKGLGEGTGLGLSVVQGIVRTHNGAITVKSKLGKGTVFEVLFPLTKEETLSEAKVDSCFPTGNEKILLIDDEAALLRLVKKRLEMQGYQVETQSSSVDALELFRDGPDRFDMVITDMSMPKMTGDKLAKEILLIRPEIPIVICSGYSDRIDAEKADSFGIRKYIEKPVDMSELLVSIRDVLDKGIRK